LSVVFHELILHDSGINFIRGAYAPGITVVF